MDTNRLAAYIAHFQNSDCGVIAFAVIAKVEHQHTYPLVRFAGVYNPRAIQTMQEKMTGVLVSSRPPTPQRKSVAGLKPTSSTGSPTSSGCRGPPGGRKSVVGNQNDANGKHNKEEAQYQDNDNEQTSYPDHRSSRYG
jgi:hypothetical protein